MATIKKPDHSKRYTIHYDPAFMLSLIVLFCKTIYNIHYIFPEFICFLHCRSFRINTDNRLSITLTQMHPFIRKINLYPINIIDVCTIIQFFYLDKNCIYICFRRKIYSILGNEIIRISST